MKHCYPHGKSTQKSFNPKKLERFKTQKLQHPKTLMSLKPSKPLNLIPQTLNPQH
jgi:hypothetical protein